jgi:hypothetical protein
VYTTSPARWRLELADWPTGNFLRPGGAVQVSAPTLCALATFLGPRSQLSRPNQRGNRRAWPTSPPIVQWSPRTARPRSKVFRAIKSEGRNRAGQLWGIHRGSDGQGQLPASAPALEGCSQIVAGGMGQGLGSARPIARANRAVRSPFAAFRKREQIEQLGDIEPDRRYRKPRRGLALSREARQNADLSLDNMYVVSVLAQAELALNPR